MTNEVCWGVEESLTTAAIMFFPNLAQTPLPFFDPNPLAVGRSSPAAVPQQSRSSSSNGPEYSTARWIAG